MHGALYEVFFQSSAQRVLSSVPLAECTCKTPDATRFTCEGSREGRGVVHAPFLCATDIHSRHCAKKQQVGKGGKCSAA